MKDQFVPYELAVKLKELGFDEKCLAWYNPKKFIFAVELGFIKNSENWLLLNQCAAPLWQQAFDWFREEKDLLNHLTTHLNTWGEDGALETSYGYRIMIDKDGWKCNVWEKLSEFETYEEARQACLEKLIELCKK